jgi:hypothetical protein
LNARLYPTRGLEVGREAFWPALGEGFACVLFQPGQCDGLGQQDLGRCGAGEVAPSVAVGARPEASSTAARKPGSAASACTGMTVRRRLSKPAVSSMTIPQTSSPQVTAAPEIPFHSESPPPGLWAGRGAVPAVIR